MGVVVGAVLVPGARTPWVLTEEMVAEMRAGSVIVDPNGQVVARAVTEGDELLVHACDMDATAFGKATIFDFKRHRRIEHYRRIASQTGVIRPDGTHD